MTLALRFGSFLLAATVPWPSTLHEARFTSTATPSMPASLGTSLASFDDFTQGKPTIPQELRLLRADLNGDGRHEYLVVSPSSGSAGTTVFVFLESNARWTRIATIMGRVYLGTRVNGFLEILAASRSGVQSVTKALYRFSGERYHLVRLADYTLDESGNEHLKSERDPAPSDR